MGNETVTIAPVLRRCEDCRHVRRDTGLHRNGAHFCSMCAELVRDKQGRLWLFAGYIDGQAMQVRTDQLSRPPAALL